MPAIAQRRVRPKDVKINNELVASTRITNAQDFLKNKILNIADNQLAWQHYREIGEVHFGISSGARELSRATLKAVRWRDAETSDDQEDGITADLVRAVQSEAGGQPALLQRFYTNRKVTGDGYIFAYPDDDDPTSLWFDFCSTSELTVTQPAGTGGDPAGPDMVRLVRQPQTSNGNVAKPTVHEYPWSDVICSRVWQPDPEWGGMSDSALKALAVVCEELNILTRSLRAKLLSRLATAGILLIDQSISPANLPPPDPNIQRFSENIVVDWIVRQMSDSIMDPSVVASSLPFVFQVPDVEKAINWVHMDREVFKTDIEQRNELIARILAGLDMQPERVEGFSSSNHWSAWSTQDVHLKIDVGPDMEAFCWALTKDYLWPQLRALAQSGELPNIAGMDGRRNWDEAEIRRHWVWYDLDNLTVRPNKADSYVTLADHGAINLAALREATGASEDEAPTDEEYVRQLGWLDRNIYAATIGLPIHDQIDWEKLVTVGGMNRPGPPKTAPADTPAGPGKTAPGSPAGPRESDKPKSQQPQ